MGGREFDRSLVDHFAGVLKKQGADIYAKKRALHRLKSQMHKSKEVLSANKETEFVLEGIIDDIDLKGRSFLLLAHRVMKFYREDYARGL